MQLTLQQALDGLKDCVTIADFKTLVENTSSAVEHAVIRV
jgi:hypothetical protein